MVRLMIFMFYPYLPSIHTYKCCLVNKAQKEETIGKKAERISDEYDACRYVSYIQPLLESKVKGILLLSPNDS